MNNIKVLTIGGSKNIGYFSSIRLLDLGATVTFLLRKPNVFDNDETIQNYVRSGKAKIFQGDALVKDNVERAWVVAKGDDDKPVDFLICTVGGTPNFESFSKGFVISPPNLVTQSILNCLQTLPTPHPKIIAVSASGLTRAGRKKVPLVLKPLYSLIAVPHADKRGTEEVLAHCAGWEWDAEDCPGAEVLGGDWKANTDLPAPGSLKSVVVVRPALLTDGACRADTSSKKEPYKVEDGDLLGRWTVSRKDVAHFMVEKVVRNWNEWEGRRVSIGY